MQILGSKNVPKSTYARVEARKRNLRNRILKEGLSLFAHFGLDGASVSQIVKQADTSVGAFYGLFESKTALHQAVIDETLVPVAELIDRLYMSETEPLIAMSNGLRITLAVARQYPDWGSFIARDTLVNEETSAAMLPHLRRDLARARRLKQVGDMDEMLLLAIVMGTFMSGTALASQNQLSDGMIARLTARCLVALGVTEDAAAKLVERDLSEAAFQSPIIGFCPEVA